jgi:hypothetical protein
MRREDRSEQNARPFSIDLVILPFRAGSRRCGKMEDGLDALHSASERRLVVEPPLDPFHTEFIKVGRVACAPHQDAELHPLGRQRFKQV